MDDSGLKTQNQPPLTGTMQKEHGPIGSSNSEYLAASEARLELDKEVWKAGVENTEVKLPEETPEVSYAGDAVVPKTEPEGKIHLQLTDDELKGAEKQSSSSSIRWLASLVRKFLAKIRKGNG